MSSVSLITFILSFIGIWYGAGLIVTSADRFAKKLRISPFSLSFFVLGMLTSIPEFSVGMTALAEEKPDIFIGNLIGSVPVLFFFVIPLLAIIGKSVKLTNKLSNQKLLLVFVVTLLPSVMVLDRVVTNIEGVILILAYIFLFLVIEREKGIMDTERSNVLNLKDYSLLDILKVLLGVGLVFVSSHFIVDNTLYFANLYKISPFYISVLFLSIGTNLPELSLAIRSIISGNKDVAFGDYMGSASANTLFFGLFTLLHNGEVISINNFSWTLGVLVLGTTLFYLFVRKSHELSRVQGISLLLVYLVFVILQVRV